VLVVHCRFILHAKKTAFVVEHDFIMATYLADRVIMFEGKPSVETVANEYVSIVFHVLFDTQLLLGAQVEYISPLTATDIYTGSISCRVQVIICVGYWSILAGIGQ